MADGVPKPCYRWLNQLLVLYLRNREPMNLKPAEYKLVTTLAAIEDCTAFIGTSELKGIVSHLFSTTFRTSLPNDRIGLYIFLRQGLNLGALGAK